MKNPKSVPQSAIPPSGKIRNPKQIPNSNLENSKIVSKFEIRNSKLVVARARWVKGSPRKLRWVAESLREMTPTQAVAKLKLTPVRAAKVLLSVFQQALGNAKNNAQISPEKLVVKSIQIGEGPRYKRRDKSHGIRGDSGTRHKKLSHITVELSYGA